MKRIPWLAVTMASSTVLLNAGASLGGFAQYDRAALMRGEVWRLVTGHFSHWSPTHLAWDLIAFLILGAICERRRSLLLGAIFTTAITVSLYLLAFCPEVATYRGLSAIDSALWVWAAFIIGERRVALALTLLSLFVVKVIAESACGSIFVGGFTVLPMVHLLGGVIGLCTAMSERHRMSRLTGVINRYQSRLRHSVSS